MTAFPTARQAVLCAIDIQRALLRRAARGDFPVRVRIGINTGEAIRHAGDFFGRSVVLAARIADREEIVTQPSGHAEFKGLDGRHELYGKARARPAPRSRRTDGNEHSSPHLLATLVR